MGKYMKKSKITVDVAVMEVSPQSSRGFRTRAAKTLALQRLHKPSSLSSPSYLQLRSRRLEKAPVLGQQQKAQHSSECCRGGSSPENFRTSSTLRQESTKSVGSAPLEIEEESGEQNPGVEAGDGNVMDVESSFCENNLHFGVENGSTTENTPCSFVKKSGTIETSDSTRKEMNAHMTDSRVELELQRSISSSSDIEEFFAYEELWHQRMFIEKYNFDFANDMPLQGRYEWMQVVP